MRRPADCLCANAAGLSVETRAVTVTRSAAAARDSEEDRDRNVRAFGAEAYQRLRRHSSSGAFRAGPADFADLSRVSSRRAAGPGLPIVAAAQEPESSWARCRPNRMVQ